MMTDSRYDMRVEEDEEVTKVAEVREGCGRSGLDPG
jgi:hypothetical protein